MRFTPLIFAGVAAAGIYYPAEPSSSTPAAPVKPSTSSSAAGYYYKPSSSAVASSSSAPYSKKWKTTTSYETECYTVTSSSTTKTWTSVKAIPTVCEDDEDDYVVTKSSSKSTPASPVKPTSSSLPYCEAYTETCTVTVTAGSTPTGSYAAPVKPTTPVAPVYSEKGSYPVGAAKPSGTGSYTKPYSAEFTGAASAQKAGALLAGAGAIAAMLL